MFTRGDPRGRRLYVPGDELERWMEKAFTSEQFANDPTAFRYLARTNRRVSPTSTHGCAWRYGDDIETPFVRGERALRADGDAVAPASDVSEKFTNDDPRLRSEKIDH